MAHSLSALGYDLRSIITLTTPPNTYSLIDPSHDLVVVRMGHFKGAMPGTASFGKALALLMEAVPKAK